MWIINLLAPSSFERSVDVFGGSGTVTLNLETSRCNLMVYNDFHRNLVNLMRCARDAPMRLLREVGFLSFNARDDFDILKKFLGKEDLTPEDLEAELELTEIMLPEPQAEEIKLLQTRMAGDKDVKRAAAYYKVMRYSFNANGETYGAKKCDIRRFYADLIKFSEMFRNVVIENKDCVKLISQYDRVGCFTYCDPPYYKAEHFYKELFVRSDHERLHNALQKCKGYVMVSYNDCPEIRELYSDFYIYRTTRPHSMAHKEGEEYPELILTNYNAQKHADKKTRQLNLYGEIIALPHESVYTVAHQPERPIIED